MTALDWALGHYARRDGALLVGGYTLAPDKADPALAIGIGAFSGAILGSAVAGGLAGGVATMTRQ